MNEFSPISKLLLRSRVARWVFILLLTGSMLMIMLMLFGLTGRTILLSMLSFAVAYAFLDPFSVTAASLARSLDSKHPELEFSTQLLLRPYDRLNALEHLQYERVAVRLGSLRTSPLRAIWPAAVAFAASGLALFFVGTPEGNSEYPQDLIKNPVEFQSSTDSKKVIEISDNQFIIFPPEYTGIAPYASTGPEIEVPEGSRVNWILESEEALDSAVFTLNGDTLRWKGPLKSVKHTLQIRQDGFMQFSIYNDSTEFRSTLYPVRHIEDAPPEIKLTDQEEFTAFEWTDHKEISLSAVARDDYGISNAFIIATVSSGSGESVKFREERLPLKTQPITATSVELSTRILLDSLDMTPGDELYYYIQVEDNRFPEPLTGRTPTYFVQIRDTTTYEFALAGDLGAEVMPEYFRSQRQIIIDTEKLISERKELQEKEFKSRSNALGFDQKALRLRYSQFMGDEDEMMPAVENTEPESPDEDHEEHEGHEHDEPGAAGNTENPLEEFMHDHGDPEEATFFRESLKAKLRRAMAEMWDAELHLRLYAPEESLPYQYRALELIREIKNDARIYVHRIGFEPPPIRPESRLSGDLEEVDPSSMYSEEDKKFTAWDRLKHLIGDLNKVSVADRQLILQIQSELVRLAAKQPGTMIEAISLTDDILREEIPDRQMLDRLYTEIVKAIPAEQRPVSVSEREPSSLRERLTLKK